MPYLKDEYKNNSTVTFRKPTKHKENKGKMLKVLLTVRMAGAGKLMAVMGDKDTRDWLSAGWAESA